MKKLIFFLMLTISTSSFASDICYKKHDLQSDESAQQSAQQYKDNENILGVFMTCSGVFLMAMSPQDVVKQQCPDGSSPCKTAVKKFCKKNKFGAPVGKGVSSALCAPFLFML
ncbi:hypothetical protein [Vibrio parahaemolyticus]|uniref:hypothetical protein n=1 Tax=Vibrio parahaemolyticus TaxID=670 RepID=UPI00226A6771|nr:hypothetical protein [Vibrio parahaemolyticus]MCX8796307.1 hypothetical protein [Vibrio parahaemolyticus]